MKFVTKTVVSGLVGTALVLSGTTAATATTAPTASAASSSDTCKDNDSKSSAACAALEVLLSAKKKVAGQKVTVTVMGLRPGKSYTVYSDTTRKNAKSKVRATSSDGATAFTTARASKLGILKVTITVPRTWGGKQHQIKVKTAKYGKKIHASAWLTVTKAK